LGDSSKARRVALANGRVYAADPELYALDLCAAAHACVNQETALTLLRVYREDLERQLEEIAAETAPDESA
jgi:hypothetical protein